MKEGGTEKSLKNISSKLNALLSLTLKDLTGEKDFGSKSKRKQGIGKLARYFAGFGLDAEDIAEILGAPVQSVRTLLTPKRRKR